MTRGDGVMPKLENAIFEAMEQKRARVAEQCRVGMGATADLRDAALAARYQLLEAGWGAEHPACIAMDDTATHYQRAWEGFRRQWLKATDTPTPAAAGSPDTGNEAET